MRIVGCEIERTFIRILGTGAAILLIGGGCAPSNQATTQKSGAPAAPVQLTAVSEPFIATAEDTTIVGHSPVGSYLAGRVARQEGDVKAAAMFYEHALSHDPDNPQLMRRTFSLLVADGQFDRALPLGRRVLDQNTADDLANLVVAADLVRRGDFADAQEMLVKARRGGFVRLVAGLALAWMSQGMDDTDAAMAELAKLEEIQTFDPFRTYHAGLINDIAGRDEAAEAGFREARNTGAEGSVRVTLAYGSFLEEMGRIEEAAEIYDKFLANVGANPAVVGARERLGAPSSRKPVPDAAAGFAETMFGAASLLARDQGREAAVIYLQIALHARPDFPAAQTLLGDIYESQGRWSDAIAVYQAIEPASDYYWNARIRIAWALHQLDREEDAVALLSQLAEDRPTDTKPLTTLADILRSNQRFSEAADSYRRAIERLDAIEQRHWALFYARGIAYERSAQWPLAEADFLKALDLQPDQPLVLNYLGYSWADQGVNIERARGMLERAVSLRPNDGYIVDSLGWVLFRMGHFQEAVKQLELATELRPEDPVINDHLGDAYWRVGRRHEARFQWRRALSYEPEPNLIPIIENKLESGLAPEPFGDERADSGR